MKRSLTALTFLLLAVSPGTQADESPSHSPEATFLDVESPIPLSLTAHQLQTFLDSNCPPPSMEAQPQGFLLDLTRDLARRTLDDEDHTAQWLMDLLSEANDRRLLDLTPDQAHQLATWLAHGFALALRDDLNVDELVRWIADGTLMAPPALATGEIQ